MDDDDDEMFCPSCGERMRRSVNFCSNCGESNRKQAGARWGPDPERNREPDSNSPGAEERRTVRTGPTPTPEGAGGVGHGGPGGQATRQGYSPREQPPTDSDVPWRSYLPATARRVDLPTWRVIGGAIGLGLLGFLILAVVSLIAGGIGFAAGLSVPVVLLGGTVIGQYIGFAGLSVWYLRYRGLNWESVRGYLGIHRPSLRQIGLIPLSWLVIILGAAIVTVGAQIITELLGSGQPGEAEQGITEVLADNPEFVPLAIVIMFLVVGPCEEILFRGIVQGRLREHLSAVPAIGITSVFFAVLHVGGIGGSLQGTIIAVSVLAVAGAVLGSLYEYTQNLVVVALLHGFHNSMIVLFIYIGGVTNTEGAAVLTPLAGALPF
jgi:membrane protease YdiL (CAAX protease family)